MAQMRLAFRQLCIVLAWLAVSVVCLTVIAYGLSGLRPWEKSQWEPRPYELPKTAIWLLCIFAAPHGGNG
jgi:hypothetical protein